MAKKKERERKGPKEVIGPTVVATGRALPSIRVSRPRKGFRYTSPSAIPRRSAADRRAHGCEPAPGKGGKFTGRLDREHGGLPDTYCKRNTSPCGDRQSCPVQLVWIEGAPHLRFCVAQGQPGYVVEVASPEAAQRLAEEACARWPKPTKKVAWPKAAAAAGRPESPWGSPGLGEDPPVRQSGSSAVGFFAGAVIVGLLAARASRPKPALPAPAPTLPLSPPTT